MDASSRTWPGGGANRWTVSVTAPALPGSARSDVSGLDEVALVRASLDGKAGAFDEIVVRHRRAVYQLCYRFLGNHEDASDAAQEVFLRAFRALGRFKGDSALGTWLYRIAVNLCLSRRSSKRPAAEPFDERTAEVAQAPDAMDRLLEGERAAAVRAAIARLPEKQRAVLLLRVYRDLPHQEIAAILGSSEGAVKANFFHAITALRRLLGKGSR
jgi:RNA polymerase sigma-70 factor, ECF subfamily